LLKAKWQRKDDALPICDGREGQEGDIRAYIKYILRKKVAFFFFSFSPLFLVSLHSTQNGRIARKKADELS